MAHPIKLNANTFIRYAQVIGVGLAILTVVLVSLVSNGHLFWLNTE